MPLSSGDGETISRNSVSKSCLPKKSLNVLLLAFILYKERKNGSTAQLYYFRYLPENLSMPDTRGVFRVQEK